MSDSNYLSFLEKASADHSAGTGTQAQSQSQGQSQTKTLDSDAQVPALLQSIDEFYVSETDEPFEPVVLRWEGGVLPDSDNLSSLISSGSKLSVEELSYSSFDPRGQYTGVRDKVRDAAGAGDVKVYRVETGGARVEYFVLGLEKGQGRVVGVRAKAVES